ncbi:MULTISPECIES: DivIVA domain-containing protein [unclassified Amycolatopsis]|uniref:DivIVA domain-containing protein n=1 Tax=unclassified Amycolatopsis TaxID=2618356 RepID=UPI00287617D0|nr:MULTISPECIES: DivIVA domain-containing protein [unclassified Amycolatopsis]MDS0136057.1 DivIVA domain-containing protein [Amycolatopsis sp. 505]MDS0145354.1 DivIVA domain-containing protein [Amycolatopsis sp. CM201R]
MENTDSETATLPESDVRFPIVLRGYDRRQVDEYVRVAEKRVDRHEKARRVAERRLAKAQVPAPRDPEADGAAGLGKRIEKILQVAKSEAAEIKKQAREESEKLLSAAEKTAAEAEIARAETERAAQRDAELIVSRAEEEAAAIRAAHEAVLTQLSQIAGGVEELRARFGGEAEPEHPVEPEIPDSAPSFIPSPAPS